MPQTNSPIKLDNPSLLPKIEAQDVIFKIEAYSEPSILPRILENFALRNLVPHYLTSEVKEDKLFLTLAVYPLRLNEAKHLQLRMNNILHVCNVELTFKK